MYWCDAAREEIFLPGKYKDFPGKYGQTEKKRIEHRDQIASASKLPHEK